MKLNRRKFIRTAGGAALATVAATIPALSSLKSQSSSAHKKRKVAVFFEPSFPAVDFVSPSNEIFQKALEQFDIAFLGVNEMNAQLNANDYDVFINQYGSSFSYDAYKALIKFLNDGGNLVNLGGIPFSVPVIKEGERWRQEIRQTEYHKRLGITQAFPVSTHSIHSYIPNELIEEAEGMLGEFKADEIYELYVRFTEKKDFPEEDGSAGPRDAVLRPLLFGVSDEKQKLAAPFIQIDRMQGNFAGGRWMLANFKGTLTAKAIRILTEIASQGAMELTAKTSFACYHEGELPSCTIQFSRPKGQVERIVKGDCRIEVRNERKKTIATSNVKLEGTGSLATASVDLFSAKEHLAPGLYQMNIHLKLRAIESDRVYSLKYATGFWVFDEKLLAAGTLLQLDGNYFLKDGEPYPITGTTYMTSDVHRKFLFEPNPYLWNNDFAEMKHSGVNMVRTGIWTAWKNYMLDVGSVNETAMRALDAFILTARKYDIPLIFAFFAFLPEQWGGENAYLDPRSVNAQKQFIALLAQRYRMVNDIMWDLINEPSFCSPKHLWSCRPNYDKYEQEAWSKWLKESASGGQNVSDAERMEKLQEKFRSVADESLELPTPDDFADVNIFNERKPMKVIDYRLFAQDMFAKWIQEMTAAIRSNGNPHQLITVGQDEAGTYDSPSPQFFGEEVDFTCIHNWWHNDDLMWDNVMTKTPDKPNLVEETGVMFYEKMDGSPWRTEDEARNLLERKLAIALGAGGAGFVQWIWNTNPYMASDNEAAIGLLRNDGTAKPELNSITVFAKFFAAYRHLMVGKKEEEVLMVIPHSQMFSTRDVESEATRRCVRVMNYHLSSPMRAISEYRLHKIQSPPKLIVVPSPTTFNQIAWETLLNLVEQGSTLLVTGVLDYDEHWFPVERTKSLGYDAISKNISQEEFLTIDGKEYELSYRGEKIQRTEKAVVKGNAIAQVLNIAHGKGTIVWAPLPVEVSDSVEPTVALYDYAVRQAKILPVFKIEERNPAILIRPTVFADAALYTFVSETDRDTIVKLMHLETNTQIEVNVPAQRAMLVFIERSSGKTLGKIG